MERLVGNLSRRKLLLWVQLGRMLRLLSGVQMETGVLVAVLGLGMVFFPAQEQGFKTHTEKPQRASEIYLCLRRALVDKQHLVFAQGSSSLLQSGRFNIVT